MNFTQAREFGEELLSRYPESGGGFSHVRSDFNRLFSQSGAIAKRLMAELQKDRDRGFLAIPALQQALQARSRRIAEFERFLKSERQIIILMENLSRILLKEPMKFPFSNSYADPVDFSEYARKVLYRRIERSEGRIKAWELADSFRHAKLVSGRKFLFGQSPLGAIETQIRGLHELGRELVVVSGRDPRAEAKVTKLFLRLVGKWHDYSFDANVFVEGFHSADVALEVLERKLRDGYSVVFV